MHDYAVSLRFKAKGRRRLNGERIIKQTRPPTNRCHGRERARPRDNRPANGTQYEGVIAPVSRARFARFVAHALAAARDRGMTDKDIAAATGIGTSTFHRWQRGEFSTAPDLSRVRAFCEGLGVSTSEALAALGMSERQQRPSPEPPMDPDVLIVLRALADPNVPADEKRMIRDMISMIADRHRRPRRRKDIGEEAV